MGKPRSSHGLWGFPFSYKRFLDAKAALHLSQERRWAAS